MGAKHANQAAHFGRLTALVISQIGFAKQNRLQITVAKVPPPAGKEFHVDALSGATLTSVGVDNLVRFWMGKAGYEKFLANLKAGEI